METFNKQSFRKRLGGMLKVDFKRMFTMPLVYVMAGISLAMPILILVMTTMTGGSAEPETGTEAAAAFTNVWQILGAVSGGNAATAMDITSMCNINMLYFLIAVYVCIFVAADFKSGYAKNIFTVRSKRIDYCISKTAVCFVGGAAMMLLFVVGAAIGGAIAGSTFDTMGFGAGGIAACVFAKIFLVAVFVSLSLLLGVVGKQRLWLSVLGSVAACMLMYTMIPMIAPLNAGVFNVVMCLGGGLLFAAGFCALSNLVLNKTSLA